MAIPRFHRCTTLAMTHTPTREPGEGSTANLPRSANHFEIKSVRTMATQAMAINAIVKYPVGKPFPSKFGDGNRVNVLFELEDGTTERIYGDEHDRLLCSMRKGEKVQLIRSGKQFSVVRLDDSPTRPPATDAVRSQATVEASHVLSLDRKNAIAQYVSEMGDLYAHCWQVAQAKLGSIATQEESVRCATASLFIAAQRKFGI